MVTGTREMTVEEFDRFAALPENMELDLEYIAGEIVDVVTNPKSSQIGVRLARHIDAFVETHALGHVTGADGGYQVAGERYIPDVGYISSTRMPQLDDEAGYITKPPDLAVEVVSPTDSERLLMIKVGNYLADETVVWVVYPSEKTIAVYVPGKPVQVLAEEDTLDGGDVLPGFSLPMIQVFK